jgi:hypothetical protein
MPDVGYVGDIYLITTIKFYSSVVLVVLSLRVMYYGTIVHQPSSRSENCVYKSIT